MAVEQRSPAVCNDSNKKEGKGDMTKTPISLQDLRRSLYIKAKAEPAWRFWGLYVHICKAETLHEAYLMAKKNDGAPGIDGVTFDAIEAAGVEDSVVAGRFFRGQIGGEDSIVSSRCGGIGEFLEAHLQNRIEVAEENERHIRMNTNPPGKVEDSGKCGSAAQGTFTRALNGWPVGHGVAERHAELDYVGACSGGRENYLFAGIERRIPGGNVGHDSKLTGLGEFAKTPRYSALGGARLHGGGF